MSIHWSITRAADWVIRLQEEKKTDLSKEELITLFAEWVDEAKKDKPKKSPEETKEARIKGAAKARENKKLKADSLSDEEKHEKKVLSQKKRAAKAKVGSDAWEKMTEDERDKLIEEDHRKESMKDKTDKEKPKPAEEPAPEPSEEPAAEPAEEPPKEKKPKEKKPKKEKPKKEKPKKEKPMKETEESDVELDFD